jgi:glycosyltransferase involved in cell wall biosynthesis
VGVAIGVYMLYLKLFTSIPVPGMTAIIVTIVVFGGIQILLIGIAGEYIARIFEEVKGRPLYIVEETRNL